MLVHKRALDKKVNPGDIDHVCGGIHSNESVEQAALRETQEETGVEPSKLEVVLRGVNKYNRYRTLLTGESNNEPRAVDPSEVEWVRFLSLDELKTKKESGEFSFVDEFFEETSLAIQYREQNEARRTELKTLDGNPFKKLQ